MRFFLVAAIFFLLLSGPIYGLSGHNYLNIWYTKPAVLRDEAHLDQLSAKLTVLIDFSTKASKEYVFVNQ